MGRVFMDRTELHQSVLETIFSKKEDSPFLVRIDGVDGAGKTTFANERLVRTAQPF